MIMKWATCFIISAFSQYALAASALPSILEVQDLQEQIMQARNEARQARLDKDRAYFQCQYKQRVPREEIHEERQRRQQEHMQQLREEKARINQLATREQMLNEVENQLNKAKEANNIRLDIERDCLGQQDQNLDVPEKPKGHWSEDL